MEIITNTWHYLQSIPASTWSQIGAYLVASGVIASLLQVVKNRFHIDEKKLITGLLALFSALASTADYLVTNNPAAPLPEIGSLWAYLIAGAVILHRFAVSPAYKALETWLTNLMNKVSAYQITKKPAVAAEQPTGFEG